MTTNPHVKTVITCAVPNCGKVRGDVNHWLLAEVYDKAIYFHSWDQDYFEVTSGIMPVCGDECCHRLLSQFLTKLKQSERISDDSK